MCFSWKGLMTNTIETPSIPSPIRIAAIFMICTPLLAQFAYLAFDFFKQVFRDFGRRRGGSCDRFLHPRALYILEDILNSTLQLIQRRNPSQRSKPFALR